MEVFILKKTIKEGVSQKTGKPYKIRSLFVKFEDAELYKHIVKHLESKGGEPDMIEKFVTPSEWEGETSFAFRLNCSSFTFDKVHKFGIMDADVVFDINESGFINARIRIVGGIEQVKKYIPPLNAGEEVIGWAIESQTQPQSGFDDDGFWQGGGDDLPY